MADDEVPDLVPIDNPPPPAAVVAAAAVPVAAPAAAEPAPVPEAAPLPPVPITILAGWLGAGKTTLLRYILQSLSARGKTVAIIQNETSEKMGVERALETMQGVSIVGHSVASFLKEDKPEIAAAGPTPAIQKIKPALNPQTGKMDTSAGEAKLKKQREEAAAKAAAAGKSAAGAAKPAAAAAAAAAGGSGEEVFSDLLELSNGCVCCSVRSDFVQALESLLARRRFDYVVVECSGLADPGSLAQLFWVDDELQAAVYLDAIVTVVDAKYVVSHIESKLPHSPQVVNQIAYADRILINKTDLIAATANSNTAAAASSTSSAAAAASSATSTSAGVTDLIARVRRMNRLAPIYPTVQSVVDLKQILDVRAFDARDAAAANTSAAACTDCNGSHSHSHSHSHAHSHTHASAASDTHTHDNSITTVTIELPASAGTAPRVSMERLKVWLSELLWTESYEKDSKSGADAKADASRPFIYRMKGVLHVAGESAPQYLQAVQEVFDIQSGALVVGGDVWPDGGRPYTRIVIIGRNLNHASLQRALEACVQSA